MAEKEIGITKSEFFGGLGFVTLEGRDVRLARGLRLEEVQLVSGLQSLGIPVIVSLSPQVNISSVCVSPPAPQGQDGGPGSRSRNTASRGPGVCWGVSTSAGRPWWVLC